MVVQSADGAVYSSYRQAIAYAINPNANYIFTQYKKKKKQFDSRPILVLSGPDSFKGVFSSTCRP